WSECRRSHNIVFDGARGKTENKTENESRDGPIYQKHGIERHGNSPKAEINWSNVNTRFQSLFRLITVQFFFFLHRTALDETCLFTTRRRSRLCNSGRRRAWPIREADIVVHVGLSGAEHLQGNDSAADCVRVSMTSRADAYRPFF